MDSEKQVVIPKFSGWHLRECPQCRNENPKRSRFCENCGKRLVTPSRLIMPIVNYFKALPAKIRKGIEFAVIAIIALILLGNLLGYAFDPARTVAKYYKAIANDDYGNMYECFGELPKSEFVNKDLYVELNSGLADDYFNGRIINYQITPIEEKKGYDSYSTSDKIAKRYTVAYTVNGSDRVSQDNVTVIKQKGKALFFFDKWAIAPGDIIIDNYRIKTLKGAEVTVNGIKLSDEYLLNTDDMNGYYDEESDRYDTYIIPAILRGVYSVTAKLPYSEELGYDILVAESNGMTGITDGFAVESGTVSELEKKTVDALNQVCSAIIGGKDFNTVTSLFSEQAVYNNDIEYYYNKAFNNNHRTGRMLKKFSATPNSESENYDVMINNGQVTVNVKYDYNYTVNLAKGWYNVTYEDVTSSSTGTCSAKFVYENGQWVLTNFISVPSFN